MALCSLVEFYELQTQVGCNILQVVKDDLMHTDLWTTDPSSVYVLWHILQVVKDDLT